MFPGISYLNMGIGAVVGALLSFGVLSTYNILVENPRIKAETRTVVEAEAKKRTEDAINSVNDKAERARAMRRYCIDNGRVYDFATNKCR